jgi:hypothetical protein
MTDRLENGGFVGVETSGARVPFAPEETRVSGRSGGAATGSHDSGRTDRNRRVTTADGAGSGT